MRITDIQVDGFGVWTDLELQDLAEDLTVFYGPNEAGKTTLMQLLRSILYGFSPERRQRYVPPVHGGVAGGVLYAATRQGPLEIARHLDEAAASGEPGDLVITDREGEPQAPELLRELLGNVDEPTFNNVFAIGLQELQELSTLNDTEAAAELYRLASGLDRVSLIDVLRELVVSRERLLARSEDNPGTIAQLMRQRTQLCEELDKLSDQAARWARLQSQAQQTTSDVSAAETELAELNRRLHVLQLATSLHGPWLEHGRLERQLAEQAGLPDVPPGALEYLQRASRGMRKYKRRLRQIRRIRRSLREQIRQQPLNRALWAQAARIEALGEHAGWIASLESQIATLEDEMLGLEGQLENQCEQLGLAGRRQATGIPDLPPTKLALLRAPARAIREETRRLEEALEEARQSEQQALQASEQIQAALEARGEPDLLTALEAAGHHAAQLRRRVQLDERIDHLLRNRNELEEESQELYTGQALPLWTLGGLGALFIFGVLLILVGLFGGSLFSLSNLVGWALAIMGLGGTIATVTLKVVLENSAARKLNQCNQQLALLRQQIEQTKEERDELDRELPTGGGQLDSRMTAAEEQVRQLEELLPLDAERQAAEQRLDAAQRRAKQAETALEQAQKQWKNTLRRVGLPDDVAPSQLRQLATGTQQVSQLRGRLEGRREELHQRRRELATLASRIEQLFADAQLKPESDDLQARLRQLSGALAVQQQLFDDREQMQKRNRVLRRKYRKYLQQIRRLNRRRRSILVRAGVATVEELEALVQQHRRLGELRSQHAELTQQLEQALGGEAGTKILEELRRYDRLRLAEEQNELSSRTDQLRKQIGSLHQRHGAITEQLKTLVKDRSLAEKQLELGKIDCQLAKAVERWQVLAVAGLVMESVRKLYETERQPQTLQEASKYLRKLTQGHYTRIWTPLSDSVLLVDDEQGETLTLDVLSRGTREAVFICLRLALVSDYARRSAVLPLILDDVLVNFDNRRTKAAVQLLKDFARAGHQLLLFTCHEHIMKMFKAAKAEVRRLPKRGERIRPEEEAVEEVVEPVEEFEEVVTLPAEPEPAASEPVAEQVADMDEPASSEDEAADESELESNERESQGEIEYELAEDALPDWNFSVPTWELDGEQNGESEERVERPAEAEAAQEPAEASEPERNHVHHNGSADRISRFTWNSPEMWWDSNHGDAAA